MTEFKSYRNKYFVEKHSQHVGSAVEWLERLGYGADSCRKIARSKRGFAIRRPETLPTQNKCIPFLNQWNTRQQKERDGLHLSYTVGFWPLLPLRLRETFIFTFTSYILLSTIIVYVRVCGFTYKEGHSVEYLLPFSKELIMSVNGPPSREGFTWQGSKCYYQTSRPCGNVCCQYSL